MSQAETILEEGDPELVRRIVDGDRAAFDLLYRRQVRYLAGVIHRMIGSGADVDDVLQETFVDAFRGMKGLRNPENINQWLVILAVRRSQKHLKKRAASPVPSEEAANPAHARVQPEVNPEVRDAWRALATLPASERIPWLLHCVEEYTLPEVAEMIGFSLATTKRRIRSASKKMRTHGNG